MAFEQRDGQGSLFKNDRKTTDKQPDYTGNIMVEGHLYNLSAWIKTGKSGVKFMSLAVREPQQREGNQPSPDSHKPPLAGMQRPAPDRDDQPPLSEQPEFTESDIPF